MALAALGIDIVLPPFGAVRADLGLASDSIEAAGVVTACRMGLAIGQPGYGLLADRFGRKPTFYPGSGIYCSGRLSRPSLPPSP